MLECKNIQINAGDKRLFSCAALTLGTGLYALVGRNGAGKSTFLNTLLGDLKLPYGSVSIKGRLIGDLSLGELSKTISIVRSKPILHGEYKVKDILMLGRLPYQNMLSKPSTEDFEIIEAIAKQLNIADLLSRDYNSLSDGEKQLIMVGRAFVQDTDVILLDEPSAFLDLVNKQELLKHLKSLSAKKLIIFSTHHVEILPDYCDGVLLIANNELQCLEDNATFGAQIKSAFGLKN